MQSHRNVLLEVSAFICAAVTQWNTQMFGFYFYLTSEAYLVSGQILEFNVYCMLLINIVYEFVLFICLVNQPLAWPRPPS